MSRYNQKEIAALKHLDNSPRFSPQTLAITNREIVATSRLRLKLREKAIQKLIKDGLIRVLHFVNPTDPAKTETVYYRPPTGRPKKSYPFWFEGDGFEGGVDIQRQALRRL